MKNVIRSLAAIGMMLTILPVNGICTVKTVYAAEASAVTADSAVEIKTVAGEWKYEEVNGTEAVYAGSVYIAEDGSYTYTDKNGNVTTGTVKTGTEEIGGTVLKTVGFYNGTEYAFGGYYNEAQPGIISLGNGGIARLSRVEMPAKVEIKDIAGSWKYQAVNGSEAADTGYVYIAEDGSYTCTDADGAVTAGTVKTGIEVIGGTALKTVGFYNGTEYAFGGYYNDAQPGIISLGNGGISRLSRVELPAKVEIKDIAGDWRYQAVNGSEAADTGYVYIAEDGSYTYTDADGAVTAGTVKTGIEVIGGTALKTVGFYSGTEYAFGGYYDDAQPGIISLGNGGISRLARTAETAKVSTLKGDANLDGKVNVADSVTALQFLTNKEKYPLSEQAAANTDCDGVKGISGGDAIYIQKLDAGIIW